jgi:hypothetical protein
MADAEILTLPVTLKEQRVLLGGRSYTLRELDGLGRDAYLSEMLKRVVIKEDGKIDPPRDVSGLSILLLSLTLHDPDGKPVPAEVIGKWPSPTVEALHQASQKLSVLSMTEATQLGNA